MEIVHPGFENAEASAALAQRIGTLHGKTVATLDNRHFNVDVALGRLGDHLRQQYGVQLLALKKANANSPAAAEVLSEAVSSADAVVNGVAD